jgi:hypothetical protein
MIKYTCIVRNKAISRYQRYDFTCVALFTCAQQSSNATTKSAARPQFSCFPKLSSQKRGRTDRLEINFCGYSPDLFDFGQSDVAYGNSSTENKKLLDGGTNWQALCKFNQSDNKRTRSLVNQIKDFKSSLKISNEHFHYGYNLTLYQESNDMS